jgi:hypothetical protein
VSLKLFDATVSETIKRIATGVLAGKPVTRDEAAWLFGLESTADILHLLAWAGQVREHFKGRQGPPLLHYQC